ncbi:MAG: hypothetical protein IJ637_09485 [Prevotella sp.]|nr:hypothetical protein [Prevotella sp.]
MKYFLPIIACLMLLASCSKSSGGSERSLARRTVIVYMAAENNLGTGYEATNIQDMAKGSLNLGDDCRLLVFLDKPNSYVKPFIAQVTKDATHPLDTLYRYEEDFLTSDGDKMSEVIARAASIAPAREYGLVLWGHANGWIVEKDSVTAQQRRAYGVDTGNNTSSTSGKWMNIPTLASALQQSGLHFKFIFFDCCNMQNIEVAYELRHSTDYLIGSPAEITGVGAPYNTVVKDFFLSSDEQMYKGICNDYYEQIDYVGGHLPISVIKTDALEPLAQATHDVLRQVYTNVPQDEFDKGHIYYYGLVQNDGWSVNYLPNEKTLYDMNDIIRWGLAADSAAYTAWRAVFDSAVVYSRMSTYWHANQIKSKAAYKTFADFDVTAEAFGGVSMFFPQTIYDSSPYYKHNELIKRMQWYYAVGWSAVGW